MLEVVWISIEKFRVVQTLSIPQINFRNIVTVVFGIFILFLGAQINIPIKPVPITLHSVSVLYMGLMFSRGNAISAVLSYITLGVMGVPVFAKFNAGLTYFTGATCGYLIGFLACVIVMSYIREKFKSQTLVSLFITCLIGNSTIYLFGVSWLALLIGFDKAIMLGFVPFIIPGIIKSAILSSMLRISNYFKN